MRRLWLQVGQTSGAKIYSLVTALVVLSMTARFLGPAGRGIVVAATTWAALFATIGHLSLGQVALFRAAGREPGDWLPTTVGSLLAILAAAVAAAWAFAAVAYAASDGGLFQHLAPAVLVLALLALPALIWTEYATSLLMALDALPVSNVAQAATGTVNMLLVVALLVGTSLGVLAPLAGILIGGLAGALITLRAIRRRAGGWRPTAEAARALLHGGVRLHPNAIGTYLFTHASLLIVNHHRPPEETGYFSLAIQLLMVANIVPMSIGMVAYTLVGRLGPDAAWPQQRRLLAQGLLVASAGVVAGYVAAPFAIRIVAGPEFMPAVPLFRIMLASLFGMTFSAVMASQWIGRGFFKLAAVTTVVIGAVNFASMLVVVPRYGVTGAAWVTLAVYGIAVAGNGAMAVWVHRHSGPVDQPALAAQP